MTKAQVKKLETILAKVESLENDLTEARERERVAAAKRELLRLYSTC